MKNYSQIEVIIDAPVFGYERNKEQVVKWFWVRVPVTTQIIVLKAINQLVRLNLN